MRKIEFMLFVLFVVLMVPVASAELLYDYEYKEASFTIPYAGVSYTVPPDTLLFYKIEDWNNLKYVSMLHNGSVSLPYGEEIGPSHKESSIPVNLVCNGQIIGSGTSYHEIFSPSSTYKACFWLEIDEWNVSGLVGYKKVILSPKNSSQVIYNRIHIKTGQKQSPNDLYPAGFGYGYFDAYFSNSYNYIKGSTEWQNEINMIDHKVILTREINDFKYWSKLNITLPTNGSIINEGVDNYEIDLPFVDTFTWSVTSSTGRIYSGNSNQLIPLEPPIEPLPANKTFNIFIRDGNTYEPIDESTIAFKNYNTGAWALNKTVYNGYASITLPYGWYYAYINASGYYQPQPVQMVVDDNLVSSTFRIYPAGEVPEPEEPTDFLDLTVSVKNSQTGALIGGSEIGIRKYGDTGFYYNTTLPSGYTTVFLPPGNYEIFAEAPGYYQVYPARITLDQPHENIGVFLQPTTPIPAEGNVTLNLWVCYVEPGSGQAVGIPYADILISGISGDGIGYSSGSLITDMGGYLTLDIPVNTEYIAYAEKPGYLAGSTHFTVFNVSPVNMTIQMIREIPPTVPVVTPPPTIPTLPTPTEPLGFMEQSGKALGDLFGVSLSIGKMMLGVLISLAVGMGTAKNLKGGAPEFCVGFLGAAFLVTMADLIPVGFFVAMLLLMGIYIARAYFLGGENGG